MSLDDRSAAWHPAMMPNTLADIPTSISADEIVVLREPLQSEASLEPPLADVNPPPAEPQTSDAWFDNDEDAAEDWLHQGNSTEDPPVPEQIVTQSLEQDAPTPTPVATAPESSPAEELETPVTHAPTATTATTTTAAAASLFGVPTADNDNVWTGEGADDWDLQPGDSNPSAFMPPFDRSNSFPAVPPMPHSSSSDHFTDEALPSNQAHDVMSQIEELPEDGAELDNGPVVGRDAEPEQEDTAATRFEEGIPLIAASQQVETPAAIEPKEKQDDNLPDLFSAGPEDDDFFSQIRGSGDPATPDDFFSSGIDRKSTMQVMNGLGNSPIAHSPLDTPQEVEELAQPELLDTDIEKKSDDLAARWEEAFADEDGDFLLDGTETNAIDPADFFGSDDEGFLDDDALESIPPVAPQLAQTESQPPAISSQNRYAPQSIASQPPSQVAPQTVNPYLPNPAVLPPSQPNISYAPTPMAQQQYTPTAAPISALGPTNPTAPPAQQQQPDVPKAQSFADKSKGGYTSPYDLPMDVVKPRKRASLPAIPRPTSTASFTHEPPPRSSSMIAPTPPPPSVGNPVLQAGLPPSQAAPPKPAVESKAQDAFFAELPVSSQPRPASRPASRTSGPLPSPNALPSHPPMPWAQQGVTQGPGPSNPHPTPTPPPPMAREVSGGIPNLVRPETVNPYAPMSSQQVPAPATGNSTRYSPAPAAGPQMNGAIPPAATRYSPAPVGSRPSSSHISGAPILPHQPRTSSPLAHFEMSSGKSHIASSEHPIPDRRHSSQYEPRLNRIPSLPPTREVEEESEQALANPPQYSAGTPNPMPTTPVESRYTPLPHAGIRQTPPPRVPSDSSTLSPPKRASSNYAPQPGILSPPKEHALPLPLRSHTQSPRSFQGTFNNTRTEEPPRPVSAHGAAPSAPARIPSMTSQSHVPGHRARAPSQSFNLVAPTDGRENDPLKRWKGAPVIAWGVGGTIVTSFPKDIPRYGMDQTMPMILRSPGEVKVKHVKDIEPLDDRLAKFPGPLKGKSKKKDTVAWLSQGIAQLEAVLPNVSYSSTVSHDEKRATERVLLWKILRVFIEHDGVLEGTPAVDAAIRDILTPEIGASASSLEESPTFAGADLLRGSSTSLQADAVDAGAIEQIRRNLLVGDREKAVWAAVDKRLWGHAMLISNTVSPELYKQVAQEFVRKEVNYPGHSNESVAALYKVFSGNFEECVDELVPVHARAGLQLVPTSSTLGTAKDALDGLDKWRETVGLILSNRSPDDVQALNSLGELLSGYGRAEAAHICFMFGRSVSVFGGLDDPRSNFVLLGADHRRQGDQFAKEIDAFLLSEVYEYGLSLSGSTSSSAGAPHLAAYKLQHAITLAEYGYREKALQYCEAILGAILSQTKRSTYYHPILEATVDDFIKRLKQAPKEETNSWISKPNMNKVSDTMWTRFNKFVAGDENDASGTGALSEGGTEAGPFGKIAGGTPTISRPPSASNPDSFIGANIGYPGPVPQPTIPGVPMPAAPAQPHYQPPTRAASRYAPVTSQPVAPAAHTAGGPYEPSSAYTPSPRSSNEIPRNPYEPVRSSTEIQDPRPMSYGASATPQSGVAEGYPSPLEPSFAPAQVPASGYQPLGIYDATPSDYSTPSGPPAPEASDPNTAYLGYQPPSVPSQPLAETGQGGYGGEFVDQQQPSTDAGYEPPSFQPYSYEPPSYDADPEPEQEDGEGSPQPKKKSFMDDDEDDIPALRAGEKTKAEKDRENEEMFRKVAEEEAKRAAQKQEGKKGWGFGGWFGGGAKKEAVPEGIPNKPIKANLGESSSFVYDPELKRWVNKKPGAETTEAKKAAAPPPRAGPPRSAMSTPPSSSGTPPPMVGGGAANGPPMPGAARSTPQLPDTSSRPPSSHTPALPSGPPAMVRSVSSMSAAGGPPSGPPSRPATSMSNASSIDDLLGPAGARKSQKKSKKGSRYVDVMAK